MQLSRENFSFRRKCGKVKCFKKNCTDLSVEENCLGHFLKEYGRADKTRARKMMVAVGKTMGYSGKQLYLYLQYIH